MSTHSDIIVKMSDGRYKRVYCQFDGYPSHQLPILTQHYATQELAEALVSHGDMRALAPSCEKPEGHSFASPTPGHIVYYGRDRGEEGTEAREYPTLAAASRSPQHYTYIWANGEWRWIQN